MMLTNTYAGILKKGILLLVFLVVLQTAKGQDYNAISFRIDSFANVGLPKSALQQVNKLDDLARKNHNAAQQVRAAIYRMTFQSYLEEDALQAIISRLSADIRQSAYPVKPVLQSLLAGMYWNYYQQNRYRIGERTRLIKRDTDFTQWDLQTLVDATSQLYGASLAEASKEQTTPVSVLDGVLEGDSTTRYLRPTLYDLLVQRAFDFFLNDEAGLTRPKLAFQLNDPRFFGDSRSFANLEIKTSDTGSTVYKGIKYLQQATHFHLQNPGEEALADLDLQRLKFLYGKSTAGHKDSLYLAGIRQVESQFATKPISSEAFVLEGQYYQGVDSLTMAYALFNKAAKAYPNSLGGKNAVVLMNQLLEKELSATVEDVNIPNKPILALLNYRNLSSAALVIYRLNQVQARTYTGMIYSDDGLTAMRRKLNFLKKFDPSVHQQLDLPLHSDLKAHSAEFKIETLQPGHYVLLLRDTALSGDTLTGLADFQVSNLAYVARLNPGDSIQISVIDRESGKPQSGVKLEIKGQNRGYVKGKTDRNGMFSSDDIPPDFDLNLELENDTLQKDFRYVYGQTFQGNDAPEDKTVFFADRQIYRPGQTIYFKAMQLQTFNGKNKLMPGKDIKVSFKDANNKEVSSLALKTNSFGTASGSFIIPQAMLNGNVSLETADGQLDLRVEEYKRPSFKVAFLPVKKSYRLNDSVTISGTVTAFSGYGLSQVAVAYHIVRQQSWQYQPYIRGVRRYGQVNRSVPEAEIRTDTIKTDDQGRFKLTFAATPDQSAKDLNYTFQINADVTDESGETQSGETSVTIGNSDIGIKANLPSEMFKGDSAKVAISLENLNGQKEAGKLKVEISALKNPERLFKNRLWEAPGEYLVNEREFRNDFPDYAYAGEDQVPRWVVLSKLSDTTIKADTTNAAIISLAKIASQSPGMYHIKLSGENERGDTTSIDRYLLVVAAHAKPVTMSSWVIPQLNYVKPGENAVFLAGADRKLNVLVERYNGPVLVSSEWLTLDKGLQPVKISIRDTDKNVSVQFMTVIENRLYTSYQRVVIADASKLLGIKMLTFHNKLQPGQKEQWQLQVSGSGNEQQAAEMVASLYDASLDEITPPDDWTTLLEPERQYSASYFMWPAYGFVAADATQPVTYFRHDYNFLQRNYEYLDLFGYNYYGGVNLGYRNYLEAIKRSPNKTEADKLLDDQYKKNASKIKNGFSLGGRIIAADDNEPVVGASIRIKGMNIGAVTDVNGYFKLKIPLKCVLVVSYIGYVTQEVTPNTAGNLVIKLKPSVSTLNEVVLTGYSTEKKLDVTGAVGSVSSMAIRGARSVAGIQGQVAGIAIRTDNGATGNNNANKTGPNLIPLRQNFNETAFFYPQLQTDDKGQILINFTIPEALTRWRFRAFAHTKDLATGYLESEVVTQKQLSISANIPRFLREGDTITISARIANLTAGALKGKVQLQLFNAINMQPVQLLIDKREGGQEFEIAGSSTKALSFKMAIPAGLDALDYKLTADAGAFSDGEENTLPVLPNRMLVTESMPMMVRPGQTKNFTFDKLVNQHISTLQNKTLTLEYTPNPAWYALQSLPYMMEFPYECSEQVFSRYFANSLATNIVNTMPAIKRVFEQWKSTNSNELLSNLEKNQELKFTLIEETPWLRDAENESEQKKRIALLFDLNKMTDELKQNLDKLQKRQLPGGGFTWFGGSYADRYITQHIAEGMGELLHIGIGKDDPELNQIADNAISYIDQEMLNDDRRRIEAKPDWAYSDLDIHAWFTRSYFIGKPLGAALKKAQEAYLAWAVSEWTSKNVYEQGMIALTMQRYGKPAITAQIEKSLLERGQRSDELGMYWSTNRSGYFWYESPIETQSLLIELFTEAGDNSKTVSEMKIWLLRNKQTNGWQTTKATAAACYALLLKGGDLLADSGSTSIKLDGKPLAELKPEVKAESGTGYIKTSWVDEQIKPGWGHVGISNHGSTVSWGALHWQYLENLDKITGAQTNIKLERKYFIQKQTDAGAVLTGVDASHQPKTGDLLKVVVYLKADRDFEYVQLKDMRPAGTEPVDALSEYKYQDGLYYYQVTKDVATNFFISELGKGNYVFEYRLRVAQPGNFSTGITSAQCMYAPEFSAHSQGRRIVFVK